MGNKGPVAIQAYASLSGGESQCFPDFCSILPLFFCKNWQINKMIDDITKQTTV